MADLGKVYPSEIQLLRKELEIQGDLLNQERLEREASVDRLTLELAALKCAVSEDRVRVSRRTRRHASRRPGRRRRTA